MLVELANTIWKKVRLKEIGDAQPFVKELAGLSDIITLHQDAELVERAVRITLETDHPIYDCLYLACAEATGTDLITADRRFAEQAVEKLPGAPVRYIGAPGVRDWIETAANAGVIEI